MASIFLKEATSLLNVRVLVSCGTGIATSTMAAVKVKELLKKQNVNAEVGTCKAVELMNRIRDFRPHVVVSTTKAPSSSPVPVFNGLPFLTGIGADEVINQIIKHLSSLPDEK